MRHSNKECDNVAESRPGSNTEYKVPGMVLPFSEEKKTTNKTTIVHVT